MRRTSWRKSTLLGFAAAALAAGCSAEPGAPTDGASTERDVGSSQGRISQIGGVSTTAGRSTALFDVMSAAQSLDFIAVNAADLAAQNVRMSLYSVDELGVHSLVQQQSLTSAQAAASKVDQASTDVVQNRSTVVTTAATTMRQGANASRYQAANARSTDRIARAATDETQVAAEERAAAASRARAAAAAALEAGVVYT